MFQKSFFLEEGFEGFKRNSIGVSDTDIYSPEIGYGFISDELREKQELLKIPAVSNGFMPIKVKDRRPIPTFFKIDVPRQGNYLVEIEAENDGREALIFLERRRLAALEHFIGKKKFVFSVNVCDIIPEHKERIYIDKDLDVTWVGEGLKVLTIEVSETNCPTIYIAGDSTVTDQPADYPYSPGSSYSGWGQMLPAFLNESVAVSNHAHSGLTTETFRSEGHYSIIESYIRPGDYFFMQFGHNDQKLEHLREDGGYRDNLTRYIREIRDRGAFPVIVTSLARNTWFNSGEAYNDLLSAYAAECKRLGKELSVPVFDLHEFSMELIKENGLEESKKFFHPGDLTHSNDYGAYVMAGYIASEMKHVSESDAAPAYRAFKGMLRENVPDWEIDPELLKMPVLLTEEEAAPDEPYQLKMDKLSEIIKGDRK